MPNPPRSPACQSGATVTLFALPLTVLWGLFAAWSDPAQIAARFTHFPAGTAFTPTKTPIASAIGAVMLPPALFLLPEMRRLFRSHAKAEILSAQSAIHIRRIGQFLMGLASLGVVIPTLPGISLTADNPTGQRVLAVALTSDTIGFVLAGGLLVVIGRAMAKAARPTADNERFI